MAWLKNGDQGSEHFAIPYKMGGDTHQFFPHNRNRLMLHDDLAYAWSDDLKGWSPSDPG